jgi:hypothetical protein
VELTQSLNLISYILWNSECITTCNQNSWHVLDLTLSIAFGTISAGALGLAVWCFRKALKVSGTRDGDLKMFVWAMGTMIGLIVSGMSAAYILLPIILHSIE